MLLLVFVLFRFVCFVLYHLCSSSITVVIMLSKVEKMCDEKDLITQIFHQDT